MPAAATARRRRAIPVRHSRTRDTSQVTKSSAPSAMSKRYPVNGVRPRGRDSRLDGAIIACAVASLPPPPSATLRRWRIGTTEGDAASPPRWRDPGLLRCSPPRAGWQLRRERRPPGNSTVVIASGRGCHHLSVQHPHGLRDEPPTVSPATASVSNDFML